MSKKLFIAISYDDNQFLKYIQQRVFDLVQPLVVPHNGAVRLQHHLHLTVYFLGNQPLAMIPLLIHDCQVALDSHKQLYGMHSCGMYTSKISFQLLGSHGVIALMLEPFLPMVHLYTKFSELFGLYSPSVHDSLLPHITLARIKVKKDYRQLKKEVADALNVYRAIILQQLILEHKSLFYLHRSNNIIKN